MATTIGTGSDLKKLIQNFLVLEHDAIAAYTATIERLEDPGHKAKITEFRSDHERHVSELTQLARKHGAPVPTEGDMKELLTTGKVKIAGLMGGDSAVLKAMSSNENDTISAYESGSRNDAIPAADRPMFERAAADERRHKSYMDTAAQRAA
jgi:rubrerythrin